MLQQIAKDNGLEVEHRPISFDEITNFKEVGACGTAVVITPIKSITDERNNSNIKYEFDDNFDILKKLYDDLKSIQIGDKEDTHNWCRKIDI